MKSDPSNVASLSCQLWSIIVQIRLWYKSLSMSRFSNQIFQTQTPEKPGILTVTCLFITYSDCYLHFQHLLYKMCLYWVYFSLVRQLWVSLYVTCQIQWNCHSGRLHMSSPVPACFQAFWNISCYWLIMTWDGICLKGVDLKRPSLTVKVINWLNVAQPEYLLIP